jgi:hypothetical protein
VRGFGTAPDDDFPSEIAVFRARRRGSVLAQSPRGSYMLETLGQQILRYLLGHPGARDSAAGIRVWWLQPGCEATAAEVEDALEELVDRGWVETSGEGDVILFGLVPSASSEIREYLAAGEPRG